MTQNTRRNLLDSLSKGMAYSVPAVAIVVGISAAHAIYSDTTPETGYYMFASAEAEAGPEAGSEGEAEGEARR
ncbi:MAG: hypothetical protein ACQERP_06550 [Pseudomonadota bacterium]